MLEILQTMEHLHPSVYKSCSATLKVTMSSDDQVRWSYENITKELLKTGVNWGGSKSNDVSSYRYSG